MKRSGFRQQSLEEVKEKQAAKRLKATQKPRKAPKPRVALKKRSKATTATKKPKSKTQAQLKKQLDTIFSIYIRQRDSDQDGIGTCYTCGKRAHWKQLQNGHFISRSYLATRFHEDNCKIQCLGCNVFGNGKPLDFEEHLKADLGEEYVENLKKLRHTTVKYDRLWYSDQIEKYKSLCKQ